jgi:uncharacterized membrane protein YbaN (DUF454 family)
MLACALLSLALGVIGVFVPGMPTTVFILIAAWFAARGSPRLLGWLEEHRLFGPTIIDWRAGGRVSRRAKWSATVMMGLCVLVMLLTMHTRWAIALACFVMGAVLCWLWLRPEHVVCEPPDTPK